MRDLQAVTVAGHTTCAQTRTHTHTCTSRTASALIAARRVSAAAAVCACIICLWHSCQAMACLMSAGSSGTPGCDDGVPPLLPPLLLAPQLLLPRASCTAPAATSRPLRCRAAASAPIGGLAASARSLRRRYELYTCMVVCVGVCRCVYSCVQECAGVCLGAWVRLGGGDRD